MATVLRSRFSYHRRLFLLLLAFSWALVACFVTFQYSREKRFKAERLDARLQLFNLRLLDALGEGTAPGAFLADHPLPYGDLRVTVIDDDGGVLFDNSADSLPAANHLGRPEVTEALAHDTGYTIHRHSESTDRYYFYSAMKGDGIIVRSAVPYSVSLREVLAADWEFLWFMLGVTLLMSIAAYFTTRRLGHNITRLNEFAERAERGERIDEREKIRIKKQLTNNINHELKTPVAAIQGYLETLLANPCLTAEKRTAFLEKSCAQVERLRHLLSDVSTITRMDEGRELIGKEPVVLNDLIDEVRADMELRPEGQRLRVNCDFRGPVEVEGNPSLLSSVFRNLADNAAAYSGGRDIFIRLLSDTAEACTILFADNGIGVDEEHLPHLFERFYRIDKGRSRKLGGTGLGLSIVKNAVVIHGGTITVRNGERGGLEFVFTLRKHS